MGSNPIKIPVADCKLSVEICLCPGFISTSPLSNRIDNLIREIEDVTGSVKLLRYLLKFKYFGKSILQYCSTCIKVIKIH